MTVLENGDVATGPLRNATQTDYVVLSGNGALTWEPTFTFHGFRYVRVEGWPTDDTPLDKDAVTAIVVHSDMQETGQFKCSHALLNKLTQNVRWSSKSCFFFSFFLSYFLTFWSWGDCPSSTFTADAGMTSEDDGDSLLSYD